MSEPSTPPASVTTSDSLFHSTTTTHQHCTLTKTCESVIHAETNTITDLINTDLPPLLLSKVLSVTAPPTLPLPTSTHTFTHSIQTSTSASGKPIRKKFTFNITLTMNPDCTAMTISSAGVDEGSVDAGSVDPSVSVSGVITFAAGRAGTTVVAMTVRIQTLPRTSGASTSSSASISRLAYSASAKPTPVLQLATATAILTHLTNAIPTLHNHFARYSAVDLSIYQTFEATTIPAAPPLRPHEEALLKASVTYDDQAEQHEREAVLASTSNLVTYATPNDVGLWRRIPKSINDPVSYFQKIGNDSSAWGKAVATVDTTAARAFAWLYCLQTNSRMRQFVTEEGVGALRRIIPLENERGMIYVTTFQLGMGLSDRVFATWFTWQILVDERIILAFAPLEDHGDETVIRDVNEMIKREGGSHVRGDTRGFYMIIPIAPMVCRVVNVGQGNLGGIIPQAVLATRIKSQLGQVQLMQDTFMRNGNAVDAEMRSAFPRPPPLASLADSQKTVVDDCLAMSAENAQSWVPIESTSPFVSLWIKYTPPRNNERTIALGKAVAVLDCDADSAMAFYWPFLSRKRTRKSIEMGNPARVVVREDSVHHHVVANIHALPFPFRPREFLARQVCCEDVNGDLLFASGPIYNEPVDYGMKTKYVRGVARRHVRLTPVGVSQCEVTFYLYLDAGGVVPTWAVERVLPRQLSFIADLRKEFQRDYEIDKIEHDELARIMRDEPQIHTAEEDLLVNKVHGKLGILEWKNFDELTSPDHLVRMGKIFIDGGGGGVGRASITVDAPCEDCAAWEIFKMSREQVAVAGSLERSLTRINDHSTVYQVVYDFGIPGFQPREFLSSLVWRRQGDKLAVVYDDVEHEDFPHRPHYVRGTTTVYWEFEKLQPVGGFAQTRVTYSQQVDLGGRVPKFVVNGQAVNQLMYLSTIRKRFDKSLEVDGVARAQNVEMIVGHADEYSEEENRMLTEGGKLFEDFEGTKTKSLKMASILTTAKIAYKSGDKRAWGWAATIVRARPEEVLAFLLDLNRRSARQDDDVEKSMEERVNDHNVVQYHSKKTPKIISDREFLSRIVWKKTDRGFINVTCPTECASRVVTDSFVRGKYRAAYKIERKNDMETTLELVANPDVGGSVPTFIMARMMGRQLGRVTEVQERFQAMRGLEEFDAEDGRAVGEVLCTKTLTEKHPQKGEYRQSARMRELFKKYRALTDVSRKYEFFEPMMARVVRNTLKPGFDVKTKLCDVSAKEGETIGRGLALAIACNLTAEAGVNEWIGSTGHSES